MQIDAEGRAPQPLPLSFPCVHLVIRYHTEGCIDGKRRHLLTPELANETEIDHYVNKLIKELEAAREKAKRSLRKQKSRSQ